MAAMVLSYYQHMTLLDQRQRCTSLRTHDGMQRPNQIQHVIFLASGIWSGQTTRIAEVTRASWIKMLTTPRPIHIPRCFPSASGAF